MEPAPPDAQSASTFYRPHLDGLRAVAVYLVVAFHSGAHRVEGGFIGVDVFFVLSGFLVTRLLVRDLDGHGSIRLRRFYARRFRRLLPAAAVVLVATAFVFPYIATPLQSFDAKGAMRAASLYYSNWYFIQQATDYFAADVQGSPVLHFWSLSVEEQFYVAWPLLFAGLTLLARRAGRRRAAITQGAVALAMVGSAAWALWLARTDLDRAYYGTDTRAYQLLAGALLALSPGLIEAVRSRVEAWSGVARRVPAVVQAVAIGTLLVLATSRVAMSPITRGMATTALTIALLVAMEASAGVVRGALSTTPMVYLGRISYGTYLWHWLVILVLGATLELSPVVTTALAIVVATGLASASYQLLEMPIRQARPLDRVAVPVIATGLACSLLVGVAIAPRLLEVDREPARTEASGPTGSGAGLTPAPTRAQLLAADADHGEFPTCHASNPRSCIRVEGAGLHVMLLGDSNGRMYLPIFEDLARQHGFTLSALLGPGCVWPDRIQRTDEQFSRSCRSLQREWYDTLIPQLKPDVVVLVHRAIDDPAYPTPIADESAGQLDLATPEGITVYERRVRATLDALRGAGIEVALIEPAPVSSPADDQLQCLSEATYAEECRFSAPRTPTAVEQVYRRIAEAGTPGFWSIDVDRILCPLLPICDPVIGGLVVRWDPAHITTRFARTLEPDFDRLFRAEGIWP
ncbi:MAG: acyltransferase family protein [Acidimicrobiales bacterium]